MLTVVDFQESLFAKMGSHYTWLRGNWSYRFRNSLIEFVDQKNGFRQQDHVAMAIRTGDIDESKIRGRPR